MINDKDLTHWNKKKCSVVTLYDFKKIVGNIGFSPNLQDLNRGTENLTLFILRSMTCKDSKEQMATTPGRNPATMTEEEQVAHAMQTSMTEAAAKKDKKGGDGPSETREEGNNIPGPQTPAEENKKE